MAKTGTSVIAIAIGLAVSHGAARARPADAASGAVAASAQPRSGNAPKATAARPRPGQSRDLMAMLEASARGRRALVSEVLYRSQTEPHRRAEIVAAAASVMPAGQAEIAKAGEIGALLAGVSRAPAPLPVAPRMVPASRVEAASGGQVLPQLARSAFIFNTWAYIDPRQAPAGPQDDYGWALQRTALNGSVAQSREFGANWGNAAVGQAFALNLTGPNGLTGWRGRGVTVAVIDSGIDATFANPLDPRQGFSYVHPEFLGRLDLRSRKVRADGTFDLDIADDRGSHGTHVAGTIAAALNETGMTGIAPGANILALKGLGGGGDAVQSMWYAANQPDVRIINGSYGPSAQGGETTWVTGPLDNEFVAVRQALANGKVLVFATGNDFQTAPIQAQNPTGVPLFPFIRPVNAQHGAYFDGGRNYDFSILNRLPGMIVAVANLDSNLQIANGSNRCGVAAAWCISAPGGGDRSGVNGAILSTVSRGLDSASDGTPYVGPDGNRGYALFHGTSMATPHISGVLAVLMEAYPTYSARDVVRLMFATADDLGPRGVDRIYGHGLARLDRALAAGPAIDNIPDAFVPRIDPGQSQTWAAPIFTQRELQVNAIRSGANGTDDSDLIIAGVAEFRGGVRVNSGDLVVEGTLKAPQINVGGDARLLGDGLIVGNVAVDGVLKPGSGPADMFVNGNVTINKGGAFHVDIDGVSDAGGPGSYSRLILFGQGNAFTAGGTFSASFRGQDEGADNTFSARIGHRFHVIQTDEGARVVGRFTRIETETDEFGDNGLPAHARLGLIYRPTSVTLAINPASFGNLSAHGVALNRRQSGVGLALDRMQDPVSGAISGPAADIFDRLADLAPQEIAPALQQMSGSGHAHVLRGAFSSSRQFGGLIGERLGALQTGGGEAGMALPLVALSREAGFSLSASQPLANLATFNASTTPATSAAPRFALWGKLFGQLSRTGGDAVSPGARSSGGGVIIGADMAITPGLTLGAATSFARSNTRSPDMSGEATSYLGALYGSYTVNGFEIDAMAGLSHTEFRTQRVMTFGGVNTEARSSNNGIGLIASLEAGHRFRFDAGAPLWIKPFAGLSYSDLDRAAFTETGAGALGLSFPSQRFSTVQGRLGVAFGATLTGTDSIVYRPEVSLAWGRSLSDSTNSYRTTLVDQAMVLPVATTGRDALLANVKISAAFSSRFNMFAGYAGEFRSSATSHRLEGGARWTW